MKNNNKSNQLRYILLKHTRMCNQIWNEIGLQILTASLKISLKIMLVPFQNLYLKLPAQNVEIVTWLTSCTCLHSSIDILAQLLFEILPREP